MSKQIAVRLPDELVEFIDKLIEHGHAGSRAAVVAHAVDQERRRGIAARDAAILAKVEPDSEFNQLAEFAARTPLDDLD